MPHRDDSTPRSATSFEAQGPENTGVRMAAIDAERQGVIAASDRLGVPGIDVRVMPLDLVELDVLPRDLARRHLVLPLLVKDDALLLAVADPASEQAIREVEFVTGKRVYPYLADAEALREIIERAYDLRAAGAIELSPDLPHAAPPQGTRPSSPHPSIRPSPPQPFARVASSAPPIARRTRMSTLINPSPPPAGSSPRNPVVPAPAPPPPAARPAILPQPTRTCLALVSDAVAAALREGVASMGFAVTVHASVFDALTRAAAAPPTLLVIDIDLPGPHGFDVVRQARSHEGLAGVPILVVASASLGWRTERDLAGAFGVGAVLSQPFTPADVVVRVGRCLEPGAAMDEALPADADLALRKSNDAWTRGDIASAVSHLERAAAAAEDSFRLHYHLGLALGRQGELFRAIQSLERSVALHDGFFPSLKNLAVLYEKAGFRHSALESWERALHAAPDDATREQIKGRVIALLA
jgi:CheY-like chemotaxis protein